MEGDIHSHKLLIWGYGWRLEVTLHLWSEKSQDENFFLWSGARLIAAAGIWQQEQTQILCVASNLSPERLKIENEKCWPSAAWFLSWFYISHDQEVNINICRNWHKEPFQMSMLEKNLPPFLRQLSLRKGRFLESRRVEIAWQDHIYQIVKASNNVALKYL